MSRTTDKTVRLHELPSFLLGWGGRVEVRSPDFVRRRVQEELAMAVARYR